MDFGGLRGPRQTDSRGRLPVVDGKRPWTIGVAKVEFYSFYNPPVNHWPQVVFFCLGGGTHF